jgi:hypothetical protein
VHWRGRRRIYSRKYKAEHVGGVCDLPWVFVFKSETRNGMVQSDLRVAVSFGQLGQYVDQCFEITSYQGQPTSYLEH